MKLTSQEEYGLRCLLSLARKEAETEWVLRAVPVDDVGTEAAPGRHDAPPRSPERPEADRTRASLTLAQVAEREGLSIEYAGKLMGVLGRAGLVESVRGRHGGYRLSRPSDDICVSEVVAALGDKLYRPSETCDRFSGDHMFCVHSSTCSIRSLWSGLQMLLDWVLSRTTLYDLIATDERNMADWMRSQFELLAHADPPDSGPTNLLRGTVTVVGPASSDAEQAKGRNRDVH